MPISPKSGGVLALPADPVGIVGMPRAARVACGQKCWRPTELASVDAEIGKNAGACFFLNLIHPRRKVVGVSGAFGFRTPPTEFAAVDAENE